MVPDMVSPGVGCDARQRGEPSCRRAFLARVSAGIRRERRGKLDGREGSNLRIEVAWK